MKEKNLRCENNSLTICRNIKIRNEIQGKEIRYKSKRCEKREKKRRTLTSIQAVKNQMIKEMPLGVNLTELGKRQRNNDCY